MIGQEKELSRFKDFNGKQLTPTSKILIAVGVMYSRRTGELRDAEYVGLTLESGVLKVSIDCPKHFHYSLTIGEFKTRCVIWE